MKVATGTSISHYSSHSSKNGQGRKDGLVVDSRKLEDGREVHLFIVCDAEAEFNDSFASTALKTVVDSCTSDFEKADFENIKDFEQMLLNILQSANRRLYEKEQSEAVEMGASITISLLVENKLHTGHIGNCRVYIFRDGRLDQITVDQSLVINSSDYSGSDSHSKRVIVRKIGLDEMTLPQFDTRELFPDDRILFCTDGLHNVINDDETAVVVKAETDCVRISEKLVNNAKLRDADDDIAVICVRVYEEKGKTTDRKLLKKPTREVTESSKFNRNALKFFVVILLAGIAALAWYFFELKKNGYSKVGDAQSPKFRITTKKPLKKLTVNGKDRLSYLVDGAAFYRLKKNVNKFTFDAASPWAAVLKCPVGSGAVVNYGKDNIVNIEPGGIRIWVETGSVVSVDTETDGKKKTETTTIRLKDLKKELYINFLSPSEAELNVE